MRGSLPAKKRFGQHFLIDTEMVGAISRLCELRPDERCIEIGPGRGILTEALASTGCRLTAVEFDRDLIPQLRQQFSVAPNVRIIEADFLSFDPAAASIQPPYAVAGNIPYQLTAPILGWLLHRRHELSGAVIMMQREVARRVTATVRTHDWGPLAIFSQLAFTVHAAFDIPPSAFAPPPKVWSSVVKFTPRSDVPVMTHPEHFETVVRGGFAQRRKLLAKNLVAAFSLPAATVAGIFADLGLPPKLRAEELDTAGFLTLTARLAADRLISPPRQKA